MINCILTAIFLVPSSWGAPDPRAIMLKLEESRKITALEADATLTTGGGDKKTREKSFTWWRRLSKDGIGFDTLTLFRSPAEVKDEAILFLEHPGNENEVLLYLPNFKKVRRVENQQQSGSFMGSVFSYSDISTPNVDDFTYKHLGVAACPGADAAIQCDQVEAIPAKDSIRERTRTSKMVQWIRQDNFMVSQIEYFDAVGGKWKRLTASDTREVDTKAHKWMSHALRMEELNSGRYTVLQFENVKTSATLTEALFNPQNLGKSIR